MSEGLNEKLKPSSETKKHQKRSSLLLQRCLVISVYDHYLRLGADMYKRKTINYRLHGQLDLNERLAIETGLCRGESFKRIAKRLDRHPSTIAHEVLAHRTQMKTSFYANKDCAHANI